MLIALAIILCFVAVIVACGMGEYGFMAVFAVLALWCVIGMVLSSKK